MHPNKEEAGQKFQDGMLAWMNKQLLDKLKHKKEA